MIDKKTKIKGSELMLSDAQIKKLEPLADQAADYLSINLSPVWGYAIISGFMYTSNFIQLRNTKTITK